MKKLLPLLLLLTVFAACRGRKYALPPGTVKVNDTLFMDQFEITNVAYREYEYWMTQQYGSSQPEIIDKIRPDTLVWRKTGTLELELGQYYRHPAYSDYPLVGVTFRQANDYCLWRTNRVNEYLQQDPKRARYWKDYSVEYRLPSQQEWIHAASAGLDTTRYPWGFVNVWDGKKGRVFQCRTRSNEPAAHRTEQTIGVHYSGCNGYGICGMIGNVSEMCLTDSVALGGSYFHDPEDCRISHTQTYYGAESWLGFRCVCIIKPKNSR